MAHCTEDGQPEQANALPYVISNVKPHFGHFTKCFEEFSVLSLLLRQQLLEILKTFLMTLKFVYAKINKMIKRKFKI